MSNQSPRRSSLSPHSKPTSAFQWPTPPSPSSADITVKEILERYNEDPDLLKYILTAKSEEDKKKAARDTLKAEEARIHLRQMELEIAREQSRVPMKPAYPASAHPVAYYGLAPVQQQVLARFNYPQPPPSPSVPYPHSAHPLCPPTNGSKFRQISPTSFEEKPSKRSRTSISEDKISHNKVMEALKAKIQRGTTTTLPKLDETSPRSSKPLLPPIDTKLGRPEPQTTYSPSDHVLSNTRRARSLSTSSTSSSSSGALE